MPLNGIEKIFFATDFGGVCMKNKNDSIYSLNIQDIQTVATQEIDRELTDNEIENVIDLIADRIPWYDAINAAIIELIVENSK